MRHDAGVTVAACEIDGFEGFRNGADLVELDENRVADALLNAALQTLDVSDEDVIADELDLAAKLVGKDTPAFPVVLREAIFEETMGYWRTQLS